MLFSVIYASCRPHEIPKHIDHWKERTHDKAQLEFVLAVDELDPASIEAANQVIAQDHGFPFKLCIVPAPHRNCIVAWNHAVKLAEGKIVLVTSDDFVMPQDWDVSLKALRCRNPKHDHSTPWWSHSHVVHTDDGHTSLRHGICTFPIITAEWYREHGYVYHPSYTELFGDQELCEVAYRDGAMLDAKHMYIEHIHYTVHKRGCDEHDDRHTTRRAWDIDEANFKKRREAGFPIAV